MDDEGNAQTLGEREIVNTLDREFARLYSHSRAIIEQTPAEMLYAAPARTGISALRSVGESVLRSAATIEQTFGGITSNLWDDPFEWTLPEHLSTPSKVLDHLVEVEATRKQAFTSFSDDVCLHKHIAMPTGETRPLIALLLETLVRSTHHQSQAIVSLKILSGISPSGFII